MSAPDGASAGASAIPCDHRRSGDKEDAEYEGARVRVEPTLAKARIRLQIDIGFGDAIVPATVSLEYPTLLDLPAPVIRAYSKETVIAEKLEALVTLGLLNSRLKDL